MTDPELQSMLKYRNGLEELIQDYKAKPTAIKEALLPLLKTELEAVEHWLHTASINN